MGEQEFTTSSSRNRRIAKARSARRARRGGRFNFKLMAIVLGLTAAVVLPVCLWLQYSEFGSSAAKLLYIANIRYTEGEMDRALELMNEAERSQPSTEELLTIAELRRRIAKTRSMQADLTDLRRAGRSFVILQRFESQYLQENPQRREACRELIKLIETWRQNYREVCSRHDDEIDYRDMLDQVTALDQKYRAPAVLSEPDSAEDVLFAAARPTRLALRRYKKASAILDRWIDANHGDQSELDVVAQRDQYRKDCDKWVADKIVGTRTMVVNGNLDRALSQMRIVVEECALPGSIDIAKKRLRELERRAAEAK